LRWLVFTTDMAIERMKSVNIYEAINV